MALSTSSALQNKINSPIPNYIVQLMMETLNRHAPCAKVLVLGVAYERGVGAKQESPSVQIMSNLVAKGVDVSYSDPHVPAVNIDGKQLQSTPLTVESLAEADCVLILTDHPDFDYRLVLDTVPLVVDTRNATWGLPAGSAKVIRF